MRVPDLEAMVSEEEQRHSRASWQDALMTWLQDNQRAQLRAVTPEDLDAIARQVHPLPVPFKVQP